MENMNLVSWLLLIIICPPLVLFVVRRLVVRRIMSDHYRRELKYVEQAIIETRRTLADYRTQHTSLHDDIKSGKHHEDIVEVYRPALVFLKKVIESDAAKLTRLEKRELWLRKELRLGEDSVSATA